MKKRTKRQEESGGAWLGAMCEVLRGGVIAAVAAVLVLLLCAVLVSAGVLREQWMAGMAPAACVLGALFGGLIAVLRLRRRTLPAGLGVGAVLFLLLLTIGLIVFESSSLEQGGIGILSACLCGGALAGVLGGVPGKRSRR